jgi:hypothetical protein
MLLHHCSQYSSTYHNRAPEQRHPHGMAWKQKQVGRTVLHARVTHRELWMVAHAAAYCSDLVYLKVACKYGNWVTSCCDFLIVVQQGGQLSDLLFGVEDVPRGWLVSCFGSERGSMSVLCILYLGAIP